MSVGAEKVVYLFGAGASHACVKAVGSSQGILMGDLGQELADRLRKLVENKYSRQKTLQNLVNDVIDERTDFEHIITFLDQSSSALHREFAANLRQIFESVLREKLQRIYDEQGRTPDDLYFALLDMHAVPGLNEELAGMLTLNYDGYLENAVRRSPKRILDVGVNFERPMISNGHTTLLKLHGSFEWSETWPITKSDGGATLWIPPGIQKAKERYPFNLLWGLAKELLDCDVLRIIGCRLGPNDWDLISLLFATRHTSSTERSYRIELIDSPENAIRLQDNHPYLGVVSLLEIDGIGESLVAEFIGGAPRRYDSLAGDEQASVIKAATGKNWFWVWLKQKAERMYEDLGTVTTDEGAFERFLESHS